MVVLMRPFGVQKGCDKIAELFVSILFAPVAQRIERRFPKPCVGGSSPLGGASIFRSAQGGPFLLQVARYGDGSKHASWLFSLWDSFWSSRLQWCRPRNSVAPAPAYRSLRSIARPSRLWRWLDAALGARKQIIGLDCNFFAIRDCSGAPKCGYRLENAVNRP